MTKPTKTNSSRHVKMHRAAEGVLGTFISFEGPEGAGKSTQIKRLAAFLESSGQTCLLTKEPGGTSIGQHIRKILLHRDHDEMVPVCEALLYLADRAQHVQQKVKPALAEGQWVITDRYHDSTLAYQGAARGVEAQALQTLFQLATDSLKPDMTILLDLPVEIGLSRAQRRNAEQQLEAEEGRFEAETLAFHQRVRRYFLDLATQEPARFFVVDATQSIEAIAAEIRLQFAQRWALPHV